MKLLYVIDDPKAMDHKGKFPRSTAPLFEARLKAKAFVFEQLQRNQPRGMSCQNHYHSIYQHTMFGGESEDTGLSYRLLRSALEAEVLPRADAPVYVFYGHRPYPTKPLTLDLVEFTGVVLEAKFPKYALLESTITTDTHVGLSTSERLRA